MVCHLKLSLKPTQMDARRPSINSNDTVRIDSNKLLSKLSAKSGEKLVFDSPNSSGGGISKIGTMALTSTGVIPSFRPRNSTIASRLVAFKLHPGSCEPLD